jgi:hypothetical protein
MKPDIHGVRTHWIRGFMTFQLGRRTRTVMLMVLAWPESGFGEGAAPPAAAGSAALPSISMNAASMSCQQGGGARDSGHGNGLGAHEYQK